LWASFSVSSFLIFIAIAWYLYTSYYIPIYHRSWTKKMVFGGHWKVLKIGSFARLGKLQQAFDGLGNFVVIDQTDDGFHLLAVTGEEHARWQA
jgi:hypothetical protein